ncbi:MAG: DUF3604 domain-containing protein [Myxococcota bacterium]|jgi:hypothetical protein|nr:DUF3604 domain-containing protein [Myxococcota bacterium]MDP7434472.1 DUF3604 domain-containing protein [Myxococcota bacterium]
MSRWIAWVVLLALACSGSDRPNNAIEGRAHTPDTLKARGERQAAAERALAGRSGVPRALDAKQILFGDLHVHTTYSPDAFTLALPIMGGQGTHTLSDACDFARYCAEVDFFSYNDHAEALIPEHWAATKQAVRACNTSAGDPASQDLMVFAGWEWTQVGLTPEAHWGHKNVIFLGQEEDELPDRPIDSRPYAGDIGLFKTVRAAAQARWVDPANWGMYDDLEWLIDRLEAWPECPRDVDTRELDADCHENAPTPDVLYRKLDEWGFDNLVIPHGTAWGYYTPPLASWDKALTRRYHDPEKVRLVEIMSGHGNSEEYRDWRNFTEQDGAFVCPEPSPDFLPCCWRAGEIMRERCGDLPEAECERRVEEAKQLAMQANVGPAYVFPDSSAEDWLDCDQCRDCFKPSFNMRPLESVQYAMSLANPDEVGPDGRPLRFRFGFIASTDDHTSRPATGYKQYARKKMSFSPGLQTDFIDARAQLGEVEDPQRPVPVDVAARVIDSERLTSFTYPGGIVAVHSPSRTREGVWDALKRREVYGTSGPKLLLWFDLLNGPGGSAPMGSEVEMEQVPRFEVRAAGAFVQKPGCPETTVDGLSADRLEALCAGECDNPGEVRHPIEAIEIIRIRPRVGSDEDPSELIEDPWRRFECAPDPAGCVVQFVDPEFPSSGRDVLYYARAVQDATPAINGDLLRTEFDADGNAVSTDPCYGDYRTDVSDDCLAPARERAWSSPIFVNALR